MACRLDGYVVDIEREAEASGAAPNVDALLTGLRPLVPSGRLGYTSFGAPQFHRAIPWQVLDEKTDFAMPQIYFEEFEFGASNAAEVAACMEANRNLPSVKDILPVWSSEDGARDPATAVELQGYLDRFPGSSIWRLPHLREKGEAWNLRYDGEFPALADLVAAVRSMSYIVRRGASGRDVAAIRALLTGLGYPSSGAAEEFNDSLEAAVRAVPDYLGNCCRWESRPGDNRALTGDVPVPMLELGNRERLALIAQKEGDLRLRWVDATSPAEKYLKPLRAEMQRRGQIGASPVFFNWCGAFVLWCCREAGYALPDAPTDPPHYFATYALVAAWAEWAKAKGYWLSSDVEAMRGNIVASTGSTAAHSTIISESSRVLPWAALHFGHRKAIAAIRRSTKPACQERSWIHPPSRSRSVANKREYSLKLS